MKFLLRAFCAACLVASSPLGAELAFEELFADPARRGEAISLLVPGTRDAYFFTALDQQLRGENDAFAQTIAAWRTAAERRVDPISPDGLESLELRHAILRYDADPAGATASLREFLKPSLHATRPGANRAEDLVTKIESAMVAAERFEETNARTQNPPYLGFRNARLDRELADVSEFDLNKANWALSRISHPSHPALVPLMLRAFELDRSVDRFADLDANYPLTRSQLEGLAKAQPELLASQTFALRMLRVLKPGEPIDLEHNMVALERYLAAARDFVLTLPSAQNSLKAHVLFHHLRVQSMLGAPDRAEFITFLKLPRPQGRGRWVEVTPEEFRVQGDPVDFNADFTAVTGMPPVYDDSALIEQLLMKFLSNTDRRDDFNDLVIVESLARAHAIARLLAGADPANWSDALSFDEFRQLREEVRIRFPMDRVIYADLAKPADLAVLLKNTPELLVRIYEIDLASHLATQDSEPPVDMDLEGLVPHHQKTLTFKQPALVEHAETIPLPEIKGKGAWIVELVSGQQSARVIFRRGQLTPVITRTADAQLIRVIDEALQPVPGAVLTLGTERFVADKSGTIPVPSDRNQARTRGILSDGALAVAVNLGTRGDHFRLDAAFLLDREQLLADIETRLRMRLRLVNHGQPVPLEQLVNPTLTLSAQLLGGVRVERVIAQDLALSETMEIPFQVPSEMRTFTLTFSANLPGEAGADPVYFKESTDFSLNQDLETATLATAWFSPVAGGFEIEMRGRNGEPLASRAVNLAFIHRDFTDPLNFNARTDESGTIHFAELLDIESITLSGGGAATTTWPLPKHEVRQPASLQVAAGQDIRMPVERLTAAPSRFNFSLIETRDGQPLRDRFDLLAFENGMLAVRGLPQGNFTLTAEGRSTIIIATAGVVEDGFVRGEERIVPLTNPSIPAIRNLKVEGENLVMSIENAGPDTRVTMIGRRYLHPTWFKGSAERPFAPAVPDAVAPARRAQGYLVERRLSDELRYVLNRRSQVNYPGTMLPRPGLLLNRWTEQEGRQETQDGQGGIGGRAEDAPPPAPMVGGGSSGARERQQSVGGAGPLLDFLAQPAVIQFDVEPQENGMISLPINDFGEIQWLEITAANGSSSDLHWLALPTNDTPLRDRRLARPFATDANLIATRNAASLKAGAEATIENLLDADWRAFTTVRDAHEFLYGATGDDRLREFIFLAEWPDLSEVQKLELLAKHASHELHLFLARRDPEFFATHVKAMLEQKPYPEFIDELLLGRDLTKFLRPFAWNRLNAAEKALLAHALPDARERIVRELSQRWDREAPSPETESVLFAATLRGSELAVTDSLGLARREIFEMDRIARNIALGKRLETIIVPTFSIADGQPATDTIASAEAAIRAADRSELPPVELVLEDLGKLATNQSVERSFNDIPAAELIRNLAEMFGTRHKIDRSVVVIVPAAESIDALKTETFALSHDARTALWAQPTSENIQRAMLEVGIQFGEGSSLTAKQDRDGIAIEVTNTADELGRINQVLNFADGRWAGKMEPSLAELGESPKTRWFSDADDLSAADPFGSAPARGLARAKDSSLPDSRLAGAIAAADKPSEPGQSEKEDFFRKSEVASRAMGLDRAPAAAEESEFADPFADPFADQFADQAAANLPQAMMKRRTFAERTQIWQESNYYRHSGGAGEELIPLNRFWLELATWNGEGDFLSPQFNSCVRNANEALMCLALLDLPFSAERPETIADGSSLKVRARKPMLLFFKDTRTSQRIAEESPLLVRQTFRPFGQPFREEEGKTLENIVDGTFRTGTPYTVAMVITNPSGIGRRIEVLAQIPAGSLPIQGSLPTLSAGYDLAPYAVVNLELNFYFPAAGDFSVFPLHISGDGQILATTPPRHLVVSAAPEALDAESWAVIAKDGTPEQVLERLRTTPFAELDLTAILWRLADKPFFLQVTEILRERLHHDPRVAAYGLLHQDPASIREFLENDRRVLDLVGPYLASTLLDVRPAIHHGFEWLEFDPLVNPRAHAFGAFPRLSHQLARDFQSHYHHILGWKPKLDADDQLSLALLLLMQERVGDAIARFDAIPQAGVTNAFAYAYLNAVIEFHRGNPENAATIAKAHLPQAGPGIWAERFQTVLDQAEEIAAMKAGDRNDPAAAELADGSTRQVIGLEVLADGNLRIDHSLLRTATLQYFEIDQEVLFSKDPFTKDSQDGLQAPAIAPNEVTLIELAENKSETIVPLPPAYQQGNVLVSLASPNRTLTRVLDSKLLALTIRPSDRELRVSSTTDHSPVLGSYVKVYRENPDGSVEFHKDGYTDLRGAFDYLSHTGVDVSQVRRLAIFTQHPRLGSRTTIIDR